MTPRLRQLRQRRHGAGHALRRVHAALDRRSGGVNQRKKIPLPKTVYRKFIIKGEDDHGLRKRIPAAAL